MQPFNLPISKDIRILFSLEKGKLKDLKISFSKNSFGKYFANSVSNKILFPEKFKLLNIP